MTGSTLVWLRDDLRLADNPALSAAVDRGEPVVVLFVLDDDPEVARPRGGASRWWLHGSLTALGDRLREAGSRLLLRRGSAAEIVPQVARAAGARAVHWNRRYGPGERVQDTALKQGLRESGIEVRSFAGTLLFEPWTVTREDGGPYAVYSAFARACAERKARTPLPEPERFPAGTPELPTDELGDWRLLPTSPDWAAGLRETWTPGEAGAQDRLERFATGGLDAYRSSRDAPGADASSRLSPSLRFGELSPAQVWHRLATAESDPTGGKFLGEVLWREFNYSLTYFHGDLAQANLRSGFDAFPWNPVRPEVLERWTSGRTGFPLVDAGMRQLWHTGWMHNRVRMVTASFLIKNLLIDWHEGERWFWDTLVDADPASNAGNWQWVAGSGVDSAPFFRVFNPVLQSRKFDPDGDYLRAWLPELANLDASRIHEPQGAAGYPEPMVDLKESRAAALRAFATIRGG